MTAPSAHNFQSFAASGRSVDPQTRTLNHAASATRPTAKTEHEKLVKQTQTWVSQTFFGTLLKQMRDSPFKSELFDGGKGGQTFGALQDQQLAEHMTRGAGAKLVNSIVRRIEANAAYQRQGGIKRPKRFSASTQPSTTPNPSATGGATAGLPSRAPEANNTAGQASRGTTI